MTVGESRLRVQFSVGDDSVHTLIKRETAKLINLVQALQDKDPRLAAIASTAYEEAAMWAGKLAESGT